MIRTVFSLPCKAMLLLLPCILLAACAGMDAGENESATANVKLASPLREPAPKSEQNLLMETVADGLDDPWGMDFLPDGSLLVTERGGTLVRVWPESGLVRPVYGAPRVAKVGQGGLLDVVVEPGSDAEPRVYLSYSIALDEGGYTTRVARMRLWEDELVEQEVLFTALPAYRTRRHFGSRLLIVDDYLYITVGDRANRHGAQDLSVHNGKVMRLHRDGRVPQDNPFVKTAGAMPEVWSYGHRNPQGLARHPHDGSIWISEHGPQGGDEINRLWKGDNYGWPVISHGEEYGGGAIGEGTHRAGMVQPQKYYVPSIAPCGMDFYTGDRYPGWEDSLLVSALRLTHINRLQLDGEGIGAETRIFEEDKQRIRDIQLGPDGRVYALVGGRRLVKILPAP